MLVRTGGGAKCFLPHTHRLPSLPSLSLLLSSSKSDMQSGFALLEAGSLGGTTVVNILFKNFADTLVRCCVLKTSPCLHCNKKKKFKKTLLYLFYHSFHFIFLPSSSHSFVLSFCRYPPPAFPPYRVPVFYLSYVHMHVTLLYDCI